MWCSMFIFSRKKCYKLILFPSFVLIFKNSCAQIKLKGFHRESFSPISRMRIKWQILKIYDSLMSAWHLPEYYQRSGIILSIQNAKSILSSLNLCEQWVGSANCYLTVLPCNRNLRICLHSHQQTKIYCLRQILSHKCHKCYLPSHWLGQ